MRIRPFLSGQGSNMLMRSNDAVAICWNHLGLSQRMRDGFHYRYDKVLSTGEDWESLAIRQYQMEYLDLAKSGIEKIPKVERDVSIPAEEVVRL